MQDPFVARPGGVMTDEVGVVTGELVLCTAVEGCELTLTVQYAGAQEWYAVTGGRCTLVDPADAEPVHRLALGLLSAT